MGLQTQERPVDTSATLPVVDGQPEAPDAFDAAFDEFANKQVTEQPVADATGTSGAAPEATPQTQTEPAAPATPTQQTGTQPSSADAQTARPEVPAKPAPFDWSKAPQELRDAHDAELASARGNESRLEQQNKRLRGQVSSLARTPRPTHTPAAARPAAGDRAPAKPPTDADIIKIGEDIPEVAPMAESFVALRKETEQLRSERNADHAQRTEAFYQDQYEQLIAKHPDYDSLVNGKDGKTSPAFIAWAEAQPPWLQELVNKNGKELEDLSAADEVINRFRAHIATSSSSQPQGEGLAPSNPMAARRAEQLRGSETVRSRGGAAGAGPPDDFDAAFDFFATPKRKR